MTLSDVLLILLAVAGIYGILAFYVIKPLLNLYWWLYCHVAYSFRVYHRERFPRTGGVLILCNHASYIDWLVLWVAAPRRLRFVLWSGYYEIPVLKWFLARVPDRTLRLENRNPNPHVIAESLHAIVQCLEAGEAVVIFPEGRLTRNGQMRPFNRGLERIVQDLKTPVPVIPVCTSGLWGSIFSHKGGRILRRWPDSFRRRVCVWFGKPIEGKVTAAASRAAVAESMADLAIAESDHAILVPQWYVRTSAKWRNMFRPGFVDNAGGSEKRLSIGQGFVGVWCLSAWFKKRLPNSSEPIAIWLPTGLGSTLANAAVAFLRRPTVNLNYTAGRDAVESACRQAGIKTVITAKRFTSRMPLELPDDIERIHLEDALGAISKVAKLVRFAALVLLPSWLLIRLLGLHRMRPDDLLTIVFSSGSTGEPKGVMLTQRNISANVHAFQEGVDLRRLDIMLAALPFFHSFGYTVCLWAPLGVGMTAVFHPDPRAAQEIGDLCEKHRATILLGTATFIRFYLRRCQPAQFASVRLLICGAEKLPVKLQDEFHAKFGVRLLEGYGCTELSPVASTNLHDLEVKGVKQVAHKLGTVGQPIPGVVAVAADPETLAPLPPGTEGVLLVKGPNVMQGYLHQPQLTAKVLKNGWYNTGDRGLVERDGFIRITGRLSRFAKIAGEMVPLEKLEEELQELLGTTDRMIAVAAVPDEKRGERLVVLHLAEVQPKLPELFKALAAKGLPNLWLPDVRDCHSIEAFPTLGSGKLDLKGVSDLATKLAAK